MSKVWVNTPNECPPMVLWLHKNQRRRSKTNIHCLNTEHQKWCEENIKFGFEVVEVCWPRSRKICKRFGIRFENYTDLLYFKMFHNSPS